MTTSQRRFAVTALAACVLGLALTPLPFVAIGARGESELGLYFKQLGPYCIGIGFLLWRYLARPREGARRQIAVLFAEAESWMVVAALLVLVSEVNLLTGRRSKRGSLAFPRGPSSPRWWCSSSSRSRRRLDHLLRPTRSI